MSKAGFSVVPNCKVCAASTASGRGGTELRGGGVEGCDRVSEARR
ncbi:hypothetical protein [Funiculus sociatus]